MFLCCMTIDEWMEGEKRKSRKKYIKLNRHHFPYVVKPLHLPLFSPSLPIIMIIMSIIITIGRLSPSPHIFSLPLTFPMPFSQKKIYSQLLYSRCSLSCWIERIRVWGWEGKYLYVGLIYLNNSEFWSVCYGSLRLMIYWDMNKYKSSQIF